MSVRLSLEPAAGNAYHTELVDRLCDSHRHWTGRDLIAPGTDRAEALYRADFVVLAHDADSDPRFIYANLAAQRLFEMPWAEIVGLPSRFSAEAPQRAEREHLLAQVAAKGYIDDYQGVRIARSGRRFLISRATVWNLLDVAGNKLGQAATFATWQPLVM
jgi:hypothetical protein